MSSSIDGRKPEFEQLLEELAEGSEEAATRLIDLYSSNILRVVRRSLPQVIRPKIDSVDIYQSVWMSVLTKRTRLAKLDTPQRLIAYLAATARLKVLEKYRHYTKMQAFDVRRETRMSDPVGAKDANSLAGMAKNTLTDLKHPPASEIAEAREAWNTLVSNCDDRDQRIIQLRLKGETYEAIAKRLNISTRTIRRVLQRLLHTVNDD